MANNMPPPLSPFVPVSKATRKRRKMIKYERKLMRKLIRTPLEQPRDAKHEDHFFIIYAFLTPTCRENFIQRKPLTHFHCHYCTCITYNLEQFKAHLTLSHEVKFHIYRCWLCHGFYSRIKSLFDHVFDFHMYFDLRHKQNLDLRNLDSRTWFNTVPLKIKLQTYILNVNYFPPKESCNLESCPCPFCMKIFKNFKSMKKHVHSGKKGLHLAYLSVFKIYKFF